MYYLVKIVGSILILAGFGGTGLLLARHEARRPLELREWQSALKMLETEIEYALTPLPEALSTVSGFVRGPVNRCLARAQQLLKDSDGMGAGQGWVQALRENSAWSSLTRSEYEILLTLGSALGISDRVDQGKHLRLAMERLKAAELKAADEAGKRQRLYGYLGVLTGLMVILTLY